MEIRLENQLNPVADEVSALTAVIRPILAGILYALRADVVAEVGGYDNVKLKMLPRLYRPGDGDCGICFEYAVHDAMIRGESTVLDRLDDALKSYCKVKGQDTSSILFGAEKTGANQLIDTAADLLTSDSVLMYGTRGRPVKLKRHIANIAAALRRPKARQTLPSSINGLWKADLFVGFNDSDRWVGTTVKINRSQLEGARGLRIGVVPSREGSSDRVRTDDKRNLVVCPLPHDGAFMEVFYQAWMVTQQFIAADAKLPKEVALPRPPERQVARLLVDRREFPVVDVIEALQPLAQPHLLDTNTRDATVLLTRQAEIETGAIIAPQPNLAT